MKGHQGFKLQRAAMLRRTCATLALALGFVGAAQAELAVFTSADAPGNGTNANISSADTSAKTVHAFAFAGASEGTTPKLQGAGSGPLCPDNLLACENAIIAYQGEFLGQGYGAAQAGGNSGSLKVIADSDKGGSAFASAWITDTLTFSTNDRIVDITVDIDSFGALADGTSGAEMSFELFLGLTGPFVPSGSESGPLTPIASFTAFDGETEGFEFSRVVDLQNVIVDSGSVVPGSFNFQVDLLAQCTAVGINLCNTQFGSGKVVLTANLTAETFGDATAQLDQSVYLEIASPHTSLNGYQYLGPTPVPLPGAVWLFGSGAVAIAGMVQRRRK